MKYSHEDVLKLFEEYYLKIPEEFFILESTWEFEIFYVLFKNGNSWTTYYCHVTEKRIHVMKNTEQIIKQYGCQNLYQYYVSTTSLVNI